MLTIRVLYVEWPWIVVVCSRPRFGRVCSFGHAWIAYLAQHSPLFSRSGTHLQIKFQESWFQALYPKSVHKNRQWMRHETDLKDNQEMLSLILSVCFQDINCTYISQTIFEENCLTNVTQYELETGQGWRMRRRLTRDQWI